MAWQLPDGWTESADARPMRLATFIAPPPADAAANGGGEGGGVAEPLEVALSAFPDDVGGPLANLNRWRAQLGLDAVARRRVVAAL